MDHKKMKEKEIPQMSKLGGEEDQVNKDQRCNKNEGVTRREKIN